MSLVEIALKEAEAYYNQYGTSLTLRGLFYILVSKNIIPNTVSAYKRLSDVLAKARYRGEFPWHLLRDSTRRVIPMEKTTWYPTKPLSPDEIKMIIESYINSYVNVQVNPWEDQPYRIFVVVEKEALGDLVAKFISEVWEHGVREIRVIRGYDSATDVNLLAEDISQMPSRQKPVVLQLGDFDPSGEDIVRDFRERLKMLSKRDDIIFEKIAVTIDQIIDLKLPAKPESLEEITKMRRDSRYKSYVEKIKNMAETDERVKKLVEEYGSPEIRVELDALVALKPDEFKKILRETIERYFDREAYEKITKTKEEELKKKAEEIKKESLENMKKLFEEKPQL